ncbi:MAG TPA: hypothetical protein VKB22_08055 [Gemmatimonadales bacterium]|nr:hypothetical protein [Gemmatimonadales bacterium]
MRFRSVLVVVSLCLVLATSAAFGAEAPSRSSGREVPVLSSILGQFGAFLKAVWETEVGQIDPLGRTSPGTTGEDPAAPSGDDAGHIDPLGEPGR